MASCRRICDVALVADLFRVLVRNSPAGSAPCSERCRCSQPICGVERSAEESEHRRQYRDQWETKTRAQAQKYMTQQRGTFPARRMLICSATTATSQEHQGASISPQGVSDLLIWPSELEVSRYGPIPICVVEYRVYSSPINGPYYLAFTSREIEYE